MGLLVGLADAASAQDPAVRADVRVVVRYLDVVVTDRDGAAVTDLAAGDFEVLEDGEPQVVTDFRVHGADGAAAVDGAPAEPDRTYVIVLFDVKHMSFGELDRPRKAIQKLLDGALGADTLVSVMVLRRHLEVVTGFSTDHGAARARVAEILWRAPEASPADRLPAGASTGPAGGFAISLYPRYALLGPDASLFGVLEAIGDGLRTVRGLKTLVLVSEGAPASMDDDRVADSYRRMIAALNGGNVAVVAVDAEGLRGRLGRSDRLFRALPQIDLLGPGGKSSLKAISKETGGRALVGSSNFGGFLQESFEARSHVYVLGYTPREGRPAGAYRQVEVRVRRKGVRVLSRRGVPDPAPAAGMSPEQRRSHVRAAMEGWALPRDIPLAAAAAAFPVSAKESLVAVTVDLPAASGPWEADVAGALVEVASRNIHDFDLPARVARGGSVMKLLRLPFGSYVVKCVAREVSAGKLGAVEVHLDVPRLTRLEPLLSHLVLLDPAAAPPLTAAGFDDGPGAEILRWQGRLHAPSIDGVIAAGHDAVLAFGVWGLTRERRGATSGSAVVTLRREGRRLAEHRIDLARPDGRGAETLLPLHQTLGLAGEPAGSYEVEVRVSDSRRRAEVRRQLPFRVR